MAAQSVVAPMMTSRAIESNLHISSELIKQLDTMELSSLNELLDRIAALGVATDYAQIWLKPDQREIDSPQVTHHVEVVEEQCGASSPALRTRCGFPTLQAGYPRRGGCCPSPEPKVRQQA